MPNRYARLPAGSPTVRKAPYLSRNDHGPRCGLNIAVPESQLVLSSASSRETTLRRAGTRPANESAALRSEIREDLLRDRAEELLREHRAPIGEVSYLLGYAEPSNFHRAFRRWSGLTPAQWRERQHRQVVPR